MNVLDIKKERINFTKRFKQALALRNHSEKSLAELGGMFDMSRTTIQAWRTEKKLPSNFAASIVAEKLNINFEWFLTGKGDIEGFQMMSPSEVVLIEQFRNLTKQGQLKMIEHAFDKCKTNEKTSKNKADKQFALKLINKKS